MVGASAIACHTDRYWRHTNDLDVSVSIAVDDLAANLAALPELRPHPKLEHQWLGPGDVKVDILPVGPAAIEAGVIVWPRSQFRMTVLGFRLALEHRQPVSIAPTPVTDVAPLAVICLLKMIAYQDRPHERERDLVDVAYLLEEFLAPTDYRRFSEAAVTAGIGYDLASAFALGRELGDIVNAAERSAALAFINLVRQAEHPTGTQGRMARLGPRRWDHEPDELLLRISAFEQGLG